MWRFDQQVESTSDLTDVERVQRSPYFAVVWWNETNVMTKTTLSSQLF